MNPETENNLKHLEQKIEQVINLINILKQENAMLKSQISALQDINSQTVAKINFILDNINKLL